MKADKQVLCQNALPAASKGPTWPHSGAASHRHTCQLLHFKFVPVHGPHEVSSGAIIDERQKPTSKCCPRKRWIEGCHTPWGHIRGSHAPDKHVRCCISSLFPSMDLMRCPLEPSLMRDEGRQASVVPEHAGLWGVTGHGATIGGTMFLTNMLVAAFQVCSHPWTSKTSSGNVISNKESETV